MNDKNVPENYHQYAQILCRERRTFATLKKQWSQIEFKITSPDYSYEDYLKFYSQKSLEISCHE
ncbi:MAG: hypothetical protein ACI3VR_01600, partial [Intestinibacter sp.]